MITLEEKKGIDKQRKELHAKYNYVVKNKRKIEKYTEISSEYLEKILFFFEPKFESNNI